MILKDDQCPTCGQMSEDWSANRGVGSKRSQRVDAHIDRCSDYRVWRRSLGRRLYVNDIDQVEYRIVDDVIVPVVALELTRIDGAMPPPPNYLKAIITRFTERDLQGKAIVSMADRLGVDAIIVLFRQDLSEFWLYNLSNPTEQGWHHMLKERYGHWLSTHEGRRHV